MQIYYAAVGDGVLTEEEDVRLAHVRQEFGIAAEEVGTPLAHVDQLRRARLVTLGEAESIEVDFRRKKGERCFFETEAAELKQRAGRWEIARHGRLLVTSERIVFIAGTSVVLPYDAILDGGVDTTSGSIVLVTDKRKTQYHFRVDEPFVVIAHVERARRGPPEEEARNSA